MPTTTANLGLTLPTPNVDPGWGGTLNTDFTIIDNLFAAAGTGTSVGINVGTGKTATIGGTLILGSGDGTAGAAAPTAIRGAAKIGANLTGADLIIQAANGTGTGGSGRILFRTAPAGTSGTTANSMANVLAIASDGDVGIGTITPSNNLHVNGDTSTYTRVSANNAGAGAGAYYANSEVTWLIGAGPASGNDEFAFISDGTERMRIAQDGSVSIGTTSSGYKLFVNGTLRTNGNFTLDDTTGSKIYPYYASATNHNYIGAESDGSISFGSGTTSPNERARITSSGEFLVGTTSSTSGFLASIEGKAIIGDGTNVTPSGSWGGQLTISASGYASGLSADASGLWVGTNSNARAVIFATNETERARITSDGSIVVGVPSTTWNGSIIQSSTLGVTLTAGQAIQLSSTSCGAATINVYESSNGVGGTYFLNYSSTATKLAGDGAATDTGSTFAVYKSASSHVSFLKNKTAGSKNYIVTVVAGIFY